MEPPPQPTVVASAVAKEGPAPAAEETILHIETVPAHATVFIGGAKKGVAPIDLTLPRNSEPITVELRHPGYQTLKERVVPDVNQKLKLTLAAAHGPGTTTTASAPYHKFQ